jgi:hypothetical protein
MDKIQRQHLFRLGQKICQIDFKLALKVFETPYISLPGFELMVCPRIVAIYKKCSVLPRTI